MYLSHNSVKYIKSVIKDIHNKVIHDSKPPTDNQNCMLCTFCFEANMRGIKILPRAVYSPRDIIFKKNMINIIKGHRKESFKSKKDLINKIKSNPESRYYVHVKWDKNSNGGHEFIIVNMEDDLYIVDPQEGFMMRINNPKSDKYIENIYYEGSFIVRLDNKEFDEEKLRKYNDKKNIIEWDDDIDRKYVKEYKMI